MEAENRTGNEMEARINLALEMLNKENDAAARFGVVVAQARAEQAALEQSYRASADAAMSDCYALAMEINNQQEPEKKLEIENTRLSLVMAGLLMDKNGPDFQKFKGMLKDMGEEKKALERMTGYGTQLENASWMLENNFRHYGGHALDYDAEALTSAWTACKADLGNDNADLLKIALGMETVTEIRERTMRHNMIKFGSPSTLRNDPDYINEATAAFESALKKANFGHADFRDADMRGDTDSSLYLHDIQEDAADMTRTPGMKI